ncbi:MAG: tRNA preQ1(34) S-adenosylmethionine ribosyltransferase-isomerase QueA [Patescibacteria group bacterium]
MENIFDLNKYDYDLPLGLIASKLEQPRDVSRMMVISCLEKKYDLDYYFEDLRKFLSDEYVVVFNNTKVYPASLRLKKKETGGIWEMLFLGEIEDEIWEVVTPKAKRVRVGDIFLVEGTDWEIRVTGRGENGLRSLMVGKSKDQWQEMLWRYGKMPLPPYVREDEKIDYRDDYQTVFAKREGSVAAPTAGLHFTEELINDLKSNGVVFEEVTLHVGLGTFLPVKTDDIRGHNMHSEAVELDFEVWKRLLKYKKAGKKILAVGTTTVRFLESLAKGKISKSNLHTNLFIFPGYKFEFVDEMITNFHLPKSTLLMLVAAFLFDKGDFNSEMEAVNFLVMTYKKAIEKKWRFFSFGEGMWLRGGQK